MLEAAKLPIRQGAARLVDASMDRLFDKVVYLPTLKVRCKFYERTGSLRSGRTKRWCYGI